MKEGSHVPGKSCSVLGNIVIIYDHKILWIQWNLFIMDTLGPAISGSFLLLYRGFPLSEVKMY